MANDSDTPTDEFRGKKGRSPNYPSVNLETAIKWIRSVYESEKRTATTPLIVAQRCGFGGLSGPSRGAVSALKKYGLLVDADGDRIKVSDEAVKLLLQPDEAERLKIVRSVAVRPPVVRDVLATFSDGLPSSDTLRYHLVTELGFTEDGATTFIKLLLENISFAKLDPGAYTALVNPAAQPEESGAKTAVSTTGAAMQQRPTAPVGTNSVRYELSDGTLIVIDPTKPLTAETIDEVIDYLTVYRKVLSKRSQAVIQDPPKE